RRTMVQMQRGQALVSDVETLAAEAARALDSIVESTAQTFEGARRIAATSSEQESEVGRLRERVGRIAEISRRNNTGAAEGTASAREQAGALRELEGAARELGEIVVELGDLTRRLISAS